MSDKQSVQELDISEAAYHAGPCREPELSQSMAKQLLNSRMEAFHAHPKLGQGAPFRDWSKRTAATRRGDLYHALLLGQDDGIEVLDAQFSDYKTGAARKARDAALGCGRTPVLKHVHDEAVPRAQLIRDKLATVGIRLHEGKREISILRTVDAAHGTIHTKHRLDHYGAWDGECWISDLKTSRTLDPEKFERHVHDYGYHIQAASYIQALEHLLGEEWVGRIKYRWIVAQIDPVPDVRIFLPDGFQLESGLALWRKACDRWSECMATGDWPGYDLIPTRLKTKEWRLQEWTL